LRTTDHQPFEILPGESLAKYSQAGPESTSQSQGPTLAIGLAEASTPTSEDKNHPAATEVKPAYNQAQVASQPLTVETPGGQTSGSEAPEVPSAEGAISYPERLAAGVELETAVAAHEAAVGTGATAGISEVPSDVSDELETDLGFQPDSPAHGSILESDAASPRAPTGKGASGPAALACPPPVIVEPVGEIENAMSEAAVDLTSQSTLELVLEEVNSAETVETVSATPDVTGSGDAALGSPHAEAGEPVVEEEPAAPGAADRSYTLREPHQRPRFAPRRGRRGRGRFSRREPRTEGSPSRHEPSRAGNHQPVQINEILKEGQEILVQIEIGRAHV